jgi:hypothetical protein
MSENIIALVDYENIGTLENVMLSRYERLILFTGSQQEFIRFPSVTHAGNISVSVFQAPCVSKNNVDFHWYLSWDDSASPLRKIRCFMLYRMIKGMTA